MSWGQDPQDRDRDFDPWNDQRGGDVPPNDRRGGDLRPNDQAAGVDRWGGDASPQRLQPLSLGDVLDGTFRLARAHWRAFAVGLGVVVVPLSLLTGLVLAQLFDAGPSLLESLQDPEIAQGTGQQSVDEVLGGVVGTGVTNLASLLLTPLIYGIAVWIGAQAYRTGSVDPMDGVRAAGRRYLALLGAAILLGVVPLLIFIVPAVVLGFGAASGVDALLVAGGIGLLAAAVLAVMAVIRFTVTIPAVMLEGAGPVQGLRRSNTLVKGRTGFVLGTMVVVYLVTSIIQIVVGAPFLVIGGLFSSALAAIVITAGNIVTSILANALLGIAIVLIYFDRRVRLEGYDLTELADELGESPDHGW